MSILGDIGQAATSIASPFGNLLSGANSLATIAGANPANIAKTQFANATGQQVPGLNTTPQQLAQGLVNGNSGTYTMNGNIYNSAGDIVGKAGGVASDSTGGTTSGSGAYNGGSNGTGSGTSGAGSTADIAAYQDQINSLNQLLGNADVTQRNGQNSIEQGYNNSVAQLDGNNQSVLNQFNTQKTNTTNDYAKNIDHINANARQGFNSLQALLGGTGSAGNVLAPFAVSQQANSQRGASSDAFAKNLQSVDQGVLAAQQNYNNQKKTLEGQKNDQLSKLLSSIDQQKIQYQQQLAAATNQLNIARGGNYATPTANNDAINSLIANQNGLAQQFTQPNFTVSDYVAPQTDLAQYQSQAAQIGGLNNDPSTTPQDDTASALAALLKQQQQGSTNAYAY